VIAPLDARPARWAARHPWLLWCLAGAAGALVPTASAAAWSIWLVWEACFVAALALTARRSLALLAIAVVAVGVAGLLPVFLFPSWMLNARAHPIAHVALLVAAVALALPLARRLGPAHVPDRASGPRRLGARSAGLAALALALLFVYAAAKMGWAEHQARELCAETRLGSPVAGVDAAAARRGFSVSAVGPTPAGGSAPARPAMIMAFEGFAFGRVFCVVEHADGRVTRARTASLD
jgi:hypothetical protein